MQMTCETVDASQLLRDILQSKEQYQTKLLDNNNSSTASSNASSRDIYPNGGDCNGEMISPLLHSKSSDMAYNDRDNDTEVENDNDIDVTMENGSLGASGEDSDTDDRSFDHGENAKIGGGGSSDTSFNEGESKEAKRAHVENILSSMKQSPRADSADSTGSMPASTNIKMHSGTNGEMKRQKRKQPQPQQHDSAVLNSDEISLQQQMDYMQSSKRKRTDAGEDCGTGTDLEDNADDESDEDDDVETPLGDDGVKCTSVASGETKRARVEHILSALSPSVDGNKKQKRKQTQPQQHENSKLTHRDYDRYRHSEALRFDTNKDDVSSNSDDGGSESAFTNNKNNSSNHNNSSSNRHSVHANGPGSRSPGRPLPNVSQTMAGALAQDPMFSANLLRGLHDKEYPLPFHNGFDPHHLYRENLFRHGLFGIHHELDPIAAAYRGMARGVHALSESETSPRGHPNLSPADFSKITEALKNELSQVVNKTIDKVFNKVLSDKIQANSNKDEQSENNTQNNNNNNNSLSQQSQQQQQQQQQHHQQQQQQPSQPPLKVQSSPILPPQFSLPLRHQQQPTLLQQPQHQQHQQQQPQRPSSQQPQQQQQHTTTSHATEREALKETVNNSQMDKKPELIVPFSDHLHFLETYGSRRLQEKASAFEPLHKPESDLITPHTGPSMPFHPPFPYYLPTQVLPPLYTGEPEQTEALPLIVNTPKKKRTKVTDTRLNSPRSKPSLLTDAPCSSVDQLEHQRHLSSAFPHFMSPVLQTSVAITNPSLTPSDLLALRLREAAFGESRLPSPQDQSRSSPHSPGIDSPHFMSKMDMYERAGLSLAGSESVDSNAAHMTSTLTPMHLRKAKLMFFYTRYPSSAILKMYFPDVLFNKNNTAQLVKWFSNFREFFYIQMEKYARQAMAEGCKHPDDLVVTTDSELFRHLNLHYNRNNQLQVPENFHQAVEAALREFFKAIQAGKDSEPSWKKAIYKIIARMDETLPEFFKSVDWMGQLNDQ